MPDCEHPDKIEYRMGEYGESITGLGVVYIVEEVHGKCGCGTVELKNKIAYFHSHLHAKAFVIFMREHQAAVTLFANAFNALCNKIKH